MADLEDTFGSDFVQDYKQKIAERRQQREQATEEDLREIAHLAINEGKFQDGEPRFSFQNDNGITHEVRLMQLPKMENKSIFGFVNELTSGAVTCPLDYMGDWMSCLFNKPEELKEMEPGEHYIVVGKLDQWTNDKGETNDQISPVRGVLTLEEGKTLANEMLDEVGPNDSSSTTEEEDTSFEEPDEGTEESSGGMFDDGDSDGSDGGSDDDSSDDGLDGLMPDDEEEEEEDDSPVDADEVSGLVNTLAGKDEAVWEVSEGDARLNKLAQIIVKQKEYPETQEVVEEVKQYALDAIEEHNSDDDQDDDEDAIF